MKKLGKLFLFISAVVLVGTFSSCKEKGDEPNKPVVIVEDGFYLAGAATGSENIDVKYRMSAGVNEVDKELRTGMYEKYVALEAGKEFYFLLKEGTNETRYGAELKDHDTKGENDQPTVIIKKGTLKSGANAPTMTVSESGLYHVILDLNKDKALDLVGGPQIVVAPVQWGIRGINGDWGWTEMTATDFNRTEMTWTLNYATTALGDFKFAYGGGWKIQIDDAGKVKAETNLGEGLVPGASNISIDKGSNITVKLTWKLASGEISKSYSMDMTGKFEYTNYADATFSLIGSAFNKEDGTPADWDYDIDLVYNAKKGKVTDATKFYGTYVFEKAGVELLEGGEFKIRKDHDWGVNFGYSQSNITGDAANFADNGGNIKVLTAGTYDVVFTMKSPENTWELKLTKK